MGMNSDQTIINKFGQKWFLQGYFLLQTIFAIEIKKGSPVQRTFIFTVIFMATMNRNKLYWILQVGGWGLVGLIMLLFAHIYKVQISTPILLKRIIIVFFAGILTTHILRSFINWRGWMLLPVEKALPRLIISVIITSVLFSVLILGSIEIFKLGVESKQKLSFFQKVLGSTFDNGLFIFPWMMIYYFYHYYNKSQKQQLDTLKLESLVKELELETIKAHINPHFIFNSLNSIRALVDENPQRARRAITELSNILRSSMQTEKVEMVSFEKELMIVKDYLALEHMRFEDRLKVEYEIDEDTLDQPVPTMMLQTLVENAIKHGISKNINGGVVKVISDFKGDFHEMIVQNTGYLNGTINADGFGLSSTTNRLNLLYGEKARFDIKQISGSLVEAKLQLPATTI
jgi:two-component system LytT family sensor kinase